MKLIALALAILLAACGSKNDRKPDVAPTAEPLPYRMATASEVFSLRSKCAELGQKIEDDDVHGAAINVAATSRYNPKTNRCYVLLESTGVDDMENQHMSILFDGQTKEMLAFSGKDKGKSKSFMFATWPVASDPAERNLPQAEQIADYISEQMHDDRAN